VLQCQHVQRFYHTTIAALTNVSHFCDTSRLPGRVMTMVRIAKYIMTQMQCLQ